MATETQAETPATEVKPDSFRGLHPIFRDCVGEQEYRYHVDAPWREGDFIYATDSKWAVRVPIWALGPDVDLVALEPGERRVPKNIGSVIFDCPAWLYQANPIALPDVGPPRRECGACKGGKTTPERTCPRCHGGPLCECRCGHAHTCGRCDGKGKLPPRPCKACNGTGRGRPEKESVKLEGGVMLDRHFVSILREYFAAVYLPENFEPDVPARFTIGLVEGRVCQITRCDD